MNTRTPLAAALLMTASLSMAQPLANPGLTNFSGPGNSFGMSGPTAPLDDFVFKCGTVPYNACTSKELNLRESVKNAGTCPQPASQACINYLMTTSGASNPTQTIAAYTPPTGAQWASPDCQHIPCALADPGSTPDASAPTTPYDQQPGFIGPPLPPGFYDKQDKEALKTAQAGIGQNGVKDVIDLGNGRLAVMMDNGDVGMCSRSSCGKPTPASASTDPKIQAWVANNNMTDGSSGGGTTKRQPSGGFGITSVPPGGGTPDASGTPSVTPTGGTTGTTGDDAPPTGNPARSLGAGIGGEQTVLAKGFGTTGAGASGEGTVAAATGDVKPIIKVNPDEVKAQAAKGYTYTRIDKAAVDSEHIINGGAATFTSGTDPNAGGLKFRGIQSDANK